MSKRVIGIADFRLYALAAGIKHSLFSQIRGLKWFLEVPELSFSESLYRLINLLGTHGK